MILSSFSPASLPPSFAHSSISCATLHLSAPAAPLHRRTRDPSFLLCSLPCLSFTLFVFFTSFSLFILSEVGVFVLLQHIRNDHCWVKAVLSSNCQQERENRCVFSLMTVQFFYHHPVGFGSASKPERLKNSEEHVIL